MRLIEPISRAHEAALVELVAHETDSHAGLPRPARAASAGAWIDAAARELAHGRAITLAISDEAGPAGTARLAYAERGAMQLSYWVGAPRRGRGLATSAGLAALEVAFDRLGADELHTVARADNGASVRVLQKLGFNEHAAPPGWRRFSLGRDDRARAPSPFARRPWMLVIRDVQLFALCEGPRARLTRALIADLRRELPADVEPLDDAPLTTRIHAALERGQRYGLNHDRDLTRFVLLTFKIAARFDEHAPFKRILTNEELAPAARLPTLLRSATPADWEAARALDGAKP